jgi:hypothetical protein
MDESGGINFLDQVMNPVGASLDMAMRSRAGLDPVYRDWIDIQTDFWI